MTFSKIFTQILSGVRNGGYEILPDNQHIVRHCRVDEKKGGELELDAFKLRDKDIRIALEKNEKPCISVQWWEYWHKNLTKIKKNLESKGIKINQRSRFSCLDVVNVNKIGKENHMNLDVAHTGGGHAGIYNVCKNNDEFKFRRDMMLAARDRILSDDTYN